MNVENVPAKMEIESRIYFEHAISFGYIIFKLLLLLMNFNIFVKVVSAQFVSFYVLLAIFSTFVFNRCDNYPFFH